MATEQRTSRVRVMTSEAVREGLLDNKRPCVVCATPQGDTPGGGKVVALHHPDYRRAFYVIPLCRSCHGKVHAGVIPEPETGRIYTAPTCDSAALERASKHRAAAIEWRRNRAA
jgi:hypothetical protein